MVAGAADPLDHYLQHGWHEGRNPNEFFDSAWYLREHDDVAAAGINPLAHYTRHGALEGRDPHPEFSTNWYVRSSPEPLEAGVNPLAHYLRVGRLQGRRPTSPMLRYREAETRKRQQDAIERPEFLTHIAVMTYRPRFVVLIDSVDGAEREATVRSVEQQLYPAARRVATAGEALDAAAGFDPASTYLIWLQRGDQLSDKALYAFASELNADPALDLVYSDEDRLEQDERLDPCFKPDWSPDHLEALNFIGPAACFRFAIAREVLGEADGLYDFTLRFTEQTGRIRHIREVLCHRRRSASDPVGPAQARQDTAALAGRLERTGRKDVVTPIVEGLGAYRISVALASAPLVSIIIPTAGHVVDIEGRPLDLLVNCIETIITRSTYKHIEFIVVDNGDLDHGRLSHVMAAPIRFVTYAEPVFNVAKKLNLGATVAAGPILLLLNDDTEPMSPDWLEEMLAHLEKPHVGVVGAKLLFLDRTIQHVGVVLNSANPDHVRRWVPRNDRGYFFSSCSVRNFVAVTGACMLTRADLYHEVGGYTEALGVSYNDVDYCLKLRERGYTVVEAPDAELIHFKSKSRIATLDLADRDYFRKRWASIVMDPFYNEDELTVAPSSFEVQHNERSSDAGTRTHLAAHRCCLPRPRCRSRAAAPVRKFRAVLQTVHCGRRAFIVRDLQGIRERQDAEGGSSSVL